MQTSCTSAVEMKACVPTAAEPLSSGNSFPSREEEARQNQRTAALATTPLCHFHLSGLCQLSLWCWEWEACVGRGSFTHHLLKNILQRGLGLSSSQENRSCKTPCPTFFLNVIHLLYAQEDVSLFPKRDHFSEVRLEDCCSNSRGRLREVLFTQTCWIIK